MIIRHNINEADIMELIDFHDTGTTIFRVPVDPLMHQKPLRLMVPVQGKHAKQIVKGAHQSSRFTVTVDESVEGRIVSIYGPRDIKVT